MYQDGIFEAIKHFATIRRMTDRHDGIEVEGLVREFKNGPRAVDGIELSVQPGEIYGFLGPNGAGKSTTVLMLTTLLPPTAGTARVGGHDIVHEGAGRARVDRRRAAGGRARPAADRPRAHAPADDAAGRPEARAPRAAATSCSSASGSPTRPTARCGGYSGGMKRRLDLALALVHRPRDPVPRRADDRAGSAEPLGHVAGGRAAGARGRRDRVPHHAVPRGGRRAGRPHRDHRPRQDRRRRHAGRR